jgi:hypothetical protein
MIYFETKNCLYYVKSNLSLLKQSSASASILDLKGIVSRDFEVCFLVPLDSSDIATPSGAGSFFF